MIYVAYEGLGGLLIIFILAGVLVGGWAGEQFHLEHWQTVGIGILLMSALSILCGFWLNSGQQDRSFVDPSSGDTVRIRPRHSLYFIQLEYWGFIILGAGAFLFFQGLQSGSIDLGVSWPGAAHQQTAAGGSAAGNELDKAQEAFGQKKYAEALAIYQPAAEGGNAIAQFYMGLMRARGLGVAADDAAALGWFQKAADQGEMAALANIGVFYENGWSVPTDYVKALAAYRKAAEAGNAFAQFGLGSMILNGRGTDRDVTEATKWLTKAAAQGSELAKQALADIRQASSGPSYRPGKVNIVFVGATPGNYENGHAGVCTLLVNLHNDTKYHLDKVSFKIGTWRFAITDELNANSYINGYEIGNVSLTASDTCASQAAYLRTSVAKADVFHCVMPGVAEGDCQEQVAISTAISDTTLNKIADFEKSLGVRQIAPLHDAIARAGLTGENIGPISPDRFAGFAKLLDTFVAIDSQGWGFNKYVAGSMNNVSIVERAPNGSLIRLKGTYTYRQVENVLRGWVIATIQDGELKCLEYHDFAGECRAIRLPDVSATSETSDASPPR